MKKKGFTLIELIAVISIMTVLLTAILGIYVNYAKRSSITKNRTDIQNDFSNSKEKIKNKNNEILELEHIYSEETTDEITILKKKLMKNGMDQLISLKTENVSKILNRIKNYDLKQNMDKDVIDKVKELLVVDLEIIDRSFKRLKNDAAVKGLLMFHEGII